MQNQKTQKSTPAQKAPTKGADTQKSTNKNADAHQFESGGKSADSSPKSPQEIKLPTSQQTQVAKEVYGAGQRPAHENTEHQLGQVGVDPASRGRPLDDDYLAEEKSNVRTAHSEQGATGNETARRSGFRSDADKKSSRSNPSIR